MPPILPYPSPLDLEDHVFDFAFHPSPESSTVAVCLISGDVRCLRYSATEPPEELFRSSVHKTSCRVVKYSLDGDELYTGGKDRSLVVLDSLTGQVSLRKPNAHAEPLNSLLPLGPGIVASGDDGGVVKIWDVRTRKECMKYSINTDFISDFDYIEASKTLLATSADGTLSIFDIRKTKPLKCSDNQDQELLSVSLMRNNKKAVIGTEEGVLLFFTVGNWGDCTDRFPGHPGSIDTICKIDETTLLTGASDGLIRTIGIFPHQLQEILGDHNGSPIEHIRLTSDGKFAASSAHDNCVRFWRLGDNGNDDDAQDNDDDDDDDDGDDDDKDAEENEGDDEAGEDADDDNDNDDEELAGGDDYDSDDNKDSDDDDDDDADDDDDDDDDDNDRDAPKKMPPPVVKTAKKKQLESDDSDSDEPSHKQRNKKAKRSLANTKPTNSFFADID